MIRISVSSLPPNDWRKPNMNCCRNDFTSILREIETTETRLFGSNSEASVRAKSVLPVPVAPTTSAIPSPLRRQRAAVRRAFSIVDAGKKTRESGVVKNGLRTSLFSLNSAIGACLRILPTYYGLLPNRPQLLHEHTIRRFVFIIVDCGLEKLAFLEKTEY